MNKDIREIPKTRKCEMERWHAVAMEDRETVISLDPQAHMLNIYTSDQVVAYRVLSQVGEPTKTDHINGLACSMEWDIPFAEREKIRKIIAPRLLTNLKR